MGFALLYPSYNGYGGRGIARGRGGLQQCTRPHPKGPPHVALPALRCLPGIDAVLGVDVAAQPALVLAAGHLRRAVAAGHLGHAADAHHAAPQLPDPRAPSLPARVDRPRDPPVLHPERNAGSAVLATPARAGVPACEERT